MKVKALLKCQSNLQQTIQDRPVVHNVCSTCLHHFSIRLLFIPIEKVEDLCNCRAYQLYIHILICS